MRRLACCLALIPGTALAGLCGCSEDAFERLGLQTHRQPATLGGVAPAVGTHLLDASFGDAGQVVEWPYSRTDDNTFDAVAVDRFGRVLVTGHRTHSSLGPASLVVQRFDAAGRPDVSFGTNGRFELQLHPQGGVGRAIAIDVADRIWIAGTLLVDHPSLPSELLQRATLVRLLPDGTPDPDFGQGGVFLHPGLQVKRDTTAVGLALDGYGGALLLGTNLKRRPGSTKSDPGAFAAALTAQGELDVLFGEGGFLFEPGNRSSIARDIARDSSSRWVIAGELLEDPSQAALWRFDATGSPDASFGTGAVATVEEAPLDLQAVALAIDATGRIVVAGNRASERRTIERWPYQLFDGASNGSPIFDPVVWRFDSSGALDTSFGLAGSASVNLSATAGDYFDIATALALDAAGRIVVAGFSDEPEWDGAAGFFVYTQKSMALFRFTPEGALDPGFNPGGVARVTPDRADAIAMDPNGGFLVSGTLRDGAALWRVSP